MITEFTLDRARLAKSKFFDGDCACCLGQYALAAGHPGYITDDAAQKHMRELLQPFMDGKVYSVILIGNAQLFEEKDAAARAANEQSVIAAFAKAGITATFTGEYPT